MALLSVISPAGALPNVISPLAALPECLSPWKRYEKQRYAFEREFFLNQMSKVRKEWLEGTAKPSYMRQFLESQEKFQTSYVEGAYQVGMMAIAGALTIASPMMSFVLAMVQSPEWLEKTQEELDRVCGDRLPAMADMEKLPILRAVVKEVLRWRPPVPTGLSQYPILSDRYLTNHLAGIPHASTKDYVYQGYFIPAGSTIHAFEW
jgi:cytochrome P450